MNPRSQWNKPRRSQQSCVNCNAWVPNAAANPQSGKPRQGWCRAAPPGIMQGVQMPGPLAKPGTPPIPTLNGVWPPTDSNMWCRQWEPEEEELHERSAITAAS